MYSLYFTFCVLQWEICFQVNIVKKLKLYYPQRSLEVHLNNLHHYLISLTQIVTTAPCLALGLSPETRATPALPCLCSSQLPSHTAVAVLAVSLFFSRADNSQEGIWRRGCGCLRIPRRGSFSGDLSHSIARDRCICRCPDSSSPRQLYQRGRPVFCTLALYSGVLWEEREP